MLFAYGSDITLQHFLKEAMMAAASFRAIRLPDTSHIQIAIVTNNATVDATLFDLHIRPRPDLLFAGDPCPYGPKGFEIWFRRRKEVNVKKNERLFDEGRCILGTDVSCYICS